MKKWYNNALQLTAAIIFLYPLGLYGLYKSNFSNSSKLRVAIPSLFIFLGLGLSSGTKRVEKFHVFDKVNAIQNIDNYSENIFTKHKDLEKAVVLTKDHKAFKVEKVNDELVTKEIPVTNLSRFVQK